MAKGFEIGECFIGYIYNSDGKHCGKIYLDKSPQNIATFIARGLSVSRIEITDIADNMEITTFGNFLDWCSNKEYMSELLKYLIPMQMGAVNPLDNEIIYTFGSTDAQSEDERND